MLAWDSEFKCQCDYIDAFEVVEWERNKQSTGGLVRCCNPHPRRSWIVRVSITVQSENHIIMEISLYNQYFIYWHTRGDHTTWYHFSIIAWQLIIWVDPWRKKGRKNLQLIASTIYVKNDYWFGIFYKKWHLTSKQWGEK